MNTLNLKNLQIKFDKNEFKNTITNLNNIFVGAMIIASVMMLVWLWKVFNIWLFIIPASYVAMCYFGKFIRHKYFSHVKELSDQENEHKSNN